MAFSDDCFTEDYNVPYVPSNLGEFFQNKIEEFQRVHGAAIADRLIDATFIGLVAGKAEMSAFSEDQRSAEHMAEIRDMVAVYAEFKAEAKAKMKTEGIADAN